jgi:hypothetical protein
MKTIEAVKINKRDLFNKETYLVTRDRKGYIKSIN